MTHLTVSFSVRGLSVGAILCHMRSVETMVGRKSYDDGVYPKCGRFWMRFKIESFDDALDLRNKITGDTYLARAEIRSS